MNPVRANKETSFTFHLLPFTVRYPLSVFRDQWLMVNGKHLVNGKRKMVNATGGGSE